MRRNFWRQDSRFEAASDATRSIPRGFEVSNYLPTDERGDQRFGSSAESDRVRWGEGLVEVTSSIKGRTEAAVCMKNAAQLK